MGRAFCWAFGARGFPTPGGAYPDDRQQANGTLWFVSTGLRGTFEEFVSRVLRDGANVPNAHFDYEARFTGTSLAYRGFQDDGTMDIPFEIWNIGSGTPHDPSDDYRMIPVIVDIDEDGTYNLSTQDSPVSGVDNDPETDWVYWYHPVDRTPGEAGYLAWEASADTTQIGEEALARTTFVGWNLGHAPPYPAPYPEPGTVFRIVTATGVPATTETLSETEPLALDVRPNPVAQRAAVPFRLRAPGEIRLAVVDVLGREVAVLASGTHAAGEHHATLDTSTLRTGVYVVVLDGEGTRVTRTVSVVR